MRIRYTFLAGLAVLIFLVFIFHAATWKHLEFRTTRYYKTYIYSSFGFYTVSLIICYYLLPDSKIRDFAREVSALALLAMIVISVITVFPEIWEDDAIAPDGPVLFVHKENPGLIIIARHSYAGLFGAVTVSDTVMTQEIAKDIRWTKPITSKEISRDNWDRK